MPGKMALKISYFGLKCREAAFRATLVHGFLSDVRYLKDLKNACPWVGTKPSTFMLTEVLTVRTFAVSMSHSIKKLVPQLNSKSIKSPFYKNV